jgi:hypothetical protein
MMFQRILASSHPSITTDESAYDGRPDSIEEGVSAVLFWRLEYGCDPRYPTSADLPHSRLGLLHVRGQPYLPYRGEHVLSIRGTRRFGTHLPVLRVTDLPGRVKG